MPSAVRTALTQALNESAISRKELKQLMARSNKPGLIRLIFWILLVAFTGSLVWLSSDSWWLYPAMFVHGVVLVHHFSLQHECVHYTAFRTRKLNDLFGNICGFIIMLPNQHFRFEHCDHHTFTQIDGQDPELIELPGSISGYLWYCSSIPYWKTKFSELFNHILGHTTEVEDQFLSRDDKPVVFWEARVMTLLYILTLVICFAADWWAPIWFWWIPVLMGEPVMRFVRMTEHVGRPKIDDIRQNTRTNLVTVPLQFLCWNMNYHAEHHYAPSIPYYALPKLHEKLKGSIYVEDRGYLGAHVDIISQLIGRKKRVDAIETPGQ